MSKKILNNNSDFLYIYEAIQCNPNGDPDQENKPRMDYHTQTNLVTDTRIKRNIRDFLKMNEHEIFVDMEGDLKVSPDSKLKAILTRVLASKTELENIFKDEKEYFEDLKKVIAKNKNNAVKILDDLSKRKGKDKNVNFHLLSYLVKEQFPDIRMFGSAFAVPGFNKAYTGPIQMNWGYSLNKVFLMDSNSIVTIMDDGNSTFGKDYRVHYSLLALNGTANKFAAKSTNLTEVDMELFRGAIWDSLSAIPTRSKLNQYPKVYLEVIYNDRFNNGYFGDLRNFIEVKPKDGLSDNQVRNIKDLDIDFSKLIELINSNKGEGKAIKEVKVKTSHDLSFQIA